MAHLTECRELQKHTHTHANIYIMHSILLYIQCTGHDLFAFRSILHASLNGSALQVPTPANRFPGLTDQGYSSWNQPMRTTGGWEREKKNRCLLLSLCALNVPLIITMGWLQPGKSTLSPAAVSDSSGPLSQFLSHGLGVTPCCHPSELL